MFPHAELDLQSHSAFITSSPNKVMILPKKSVHRAENHPFLPFLQGSQGQQSEHRPQDNPSPKPHPQALPGGLTVNLPVMSKTLGDPNLFTRQQSFYQPRKLNLNWGPTSRDLRCQPETSFIALSGCLHQWKLDEQIRFYPYLYDV